MRRSIFISSTGLILLTLLTAPFFHIHQRAEDGHALPESESFVAVVHAHFPEEPGTSAGNDCPHDDLDHSPNKVKPFVLSALRSTTSLLEIRFCEAAAPVSIRPLIVPFAPVILADVLSIHDPPGLRLQTLRSPPAENLL